MFRVVMTPAETKLSGLGSIPDITDTPHNKTGLNKEEIDTMLFVRNEEQLEWYIR